MYSDGMQKFCLHVSFHNDCSQIGSPSCLLNFPKKSLVSPPLVRFKHGVKYVSAYRNGHSKENQEQENTAEMHHEEHVKVEAVHHIHGGLIIASILIHPDIDIAPLLHSFLFRSCNLTNRSMFQQIK